MPRYAHEDAFRAETGNTEGTHAVSAPHSIVYSMSRSITVSDLCPHEIISRDGLWTRGLGLESRDGLFETRAARVEVVAQPPRDEDVADRGQAGREARDGAHLWEPEGEQAARAQAASRSSASHYAVARREREGKRRGGAHKNAAVPDARIKDEYRVASGGLRMFVDLHAAGPALIG